MQQPTFFWNFFCGKRFPRAPAAWKSPPSYENPTVRPLTSPCHGKKNWPKKPTKNTGKRPKITKKRHEIVASGQFLNKWATTHFGLPGTAAKKISITQDRGGLPIVRRQSGAVFRVECARPRRFPQKKFQESNIFDRFWQFSEKSFSFQSTSGPTTGAKHKTSGKLPKKRGNCQNLAKFPLTEINMLP